MAANGCPWRCRRLRPRAVRTCRGHAFGDRSTGKLPEHFSEKGRPALDAGGHWFSVENAINSNRGADFDSIKAGKARERWITLGRNYKNSCAQYHAYSTMIPLSGIRGLCHCCSNHAVHAASKGGQSTLSQSADTTKSGRWNAPDARPSCGWSRSGPGFARRAESDEPSSILPLGVASGIVGPSDGMRGPILRRGLPQG